MPDSEQTAMQADENDLEAQAAAIEAAQTAANEPEQAANVAADIQQAQNDIEQLKIDSTVPAAPTILYARIRSDNTLPDPCEFFRTGVVLTRSAWTEVPPENKDEALANPYLDTQVG